MIDWPTVVAGLVAENVRQALTADVVFAAWLDPTKPTGLDYLTLKGEALFDQIEDRELDTLSLSLVRVAGPAEAQRLLRQVRERGNGQPR